jgi:hypothetical protein
VRCGLCGSGDSGESHELADEEEAEVEANEQEFSCELMLCRGSWSCCGWSCAVTAWVFKGGHRTHVADVRMWVSRSRPIGGSVHMQKLKITEQ